MMICKGVKADREPVKVCSCKMIYRMHRSKKLLSSITKNKKSFCCPNSSFLKLTPRPNTLLFDGFIEKVFFVSKKRNR